MPLTEIIAARPEERIVTGYQGARKKLLVVDDVVANRAMLVELLSTLGFEVIVASNGKEGIEQAQLTLPDLIVMDMMMPVMDGLEATRHIRKLSKLKRVPIVAVSASTSNTDQEQCRAAGANTFVAKPIDQDKLLREIGTQLELNWVVEEAEQKIDLRRAVTGPLVVPPGKEMEILYQLALVGNMRDIDEWATHIAELNKQYRPFADKLHKLAQDFDSQAILNMVEEHMRERRAS
jgi:CheY-like chemotaxis protein